MITEIVLLIVIIALLVLLGYERYIAKEERSKLINAIKAKDAQELQGLNATDKMNITVGLTKPEAEDLTPINEMTDEEFQDKIINQKVS